MDKSAIIIPRQNKSVEKENNYVEIKLPYQSSTNDVQVLLSNLANKQERYYNGYLLKTSNGDIRKIINYTGKTRICTLDKPLLIGKKEGDTIYLYKHAGIGLCFNEELDRFSILKCNNPYFIDSDNSESVNLHVKNLELDGSARIGGDIDVNSSLKVHHDIQVFNNLSVENNVSINRLKVGEHIKLIDSNISIGDFRIGSSDNNRESLTIQQNGTPRLDILENGNIKLGCEQLQFIKNGWITSNCTSGVLSLSGDIDNKNFIQVYGRGSIKINSEKTIDIISSKTTISSSCDIDGKLIVNDNVEMLGDVNVKNKTETQKLVVNREFRCDSMTTCPQIDIVQCKLGEILSVDNVDLLAINHYRMLTFTVDILPRDDDDVVEIEFVVPDATFKNKKGAVFYVDGYYEEDNACKPIFNTIGYTVPNTENACIRFTANSKLIHTLSIWCKYNVTN